MTRLYLVKTEGGDLIGWGPNDGAFIAKLEPGECIESDTRKARNPAHHRKFFALVNDAFANQEKHRTLEDLLVELKLRCGWYQEHVTSDGKLVYVPKSIAFAQMDQLEFEKFYNEAVTALAQMFPTDNVMAEADQIIANKEVA